ncbi:glycopeptide antibiotics resistance protein [Lactobacillus pasteurii DSM 23907 = CRBIP 24.76]|uniref:Glycopeptide antibiotics resistance protein n=1 Tax=Lactobacillus pasteurii DSM 23907 = CRBIP 24.76 TaxID=1423790 RepID=I7LEK3_9LACO|nr:VanZ family protein [Lactobacillus pasteurii]KRK08738.1 glycopeptide antibiotics resistance protein [Lactobacillus pasteurii DSM 23907 = CRBIP 24.76]TDG76428.1 hypothetical protein C5L33_001187 [Lactobacillus pasteurii]CCI85848.1 Glycopeptide antibiotics resistance protein [Lactobacillus pasteurii DSM 23907 = CRBIP 24.76]
MLFLGPIYTILARKYATSINHFALIKLGMLALDKTIFYFLIFAVIRLIWLLCIRHRRTVKSEASVWLWTFYLIFLFMFTTFRKSYFPWQLTFYWDRPLSDINLIFFKETWKMIYAQSSVDFIYNLFGNILCFIPLGILTPIVFSKQQTLLRVVLAGMLISITIEAFQFVLLTGVTDIDDVFFNTCGMLLGYFIFWIFTRKKQRS